MFKLNAYASFILNSVKRQEILMLRMTAIFLLMTTASFADMAAPGDWMPDARPIANIIIETSAAGNPQADIVIQGGVQPEVAQPNCSSGYNTIDMTTVKGKAQLAVALTAYSLGRPVKLALQQCSGDRPVITHIQM